MAWMMLVAAGMCEATWAVMLRQTEGWSRLGPSLVTVAFMTLSFWLLSLGLRTVPVGTAYAVWTGIGAVGTVAAGIALYGEAATVARLGGIALIVAGIATLRLAE